MSGDPGRRLMRGAMSGDPGKSIRRCASVRIFRYDTQDQFQEIQLGSKEGSQCQEIQVGGSGGNPVSEY
jgi:hypothetical protein